jgi:hypothetical protein
MAGIGARIGRWVTVEMLIAFAVIVTAPFWIEAVGLYQYWNSDIRIKKNASFFKDIATYCF